MAYEFGTFVYSSFTAAPKPRLSGYAFVGSDYVYGDEGGLAYYEATGRDVGPGHDGCYSSITATAEGFVFGTDYSGFAKLFYYRDGVHWAVGNSLILVAEHLRANGVRLYPNLPQLAGLAGRTQITGQMTAFATIFHGLWLLPSHQSLLLAGGRLILRERGRLPSANYREGLTEFVDVWQARFATLLADERVQLRSDLTGGIDSRTLFALIEYALQEYGLPRDRVYLRSSTSEVASKDYAAASAVTDHYGVTLNRRFDRPPVRRSGSETYQRWREVCLGTYMSVYLPIYRPDPFTVSMHGGGGENHRAAYGGGDFERAVMRNGKYLPAYYLHEWYEDASRSTDYLESVEPNVNRLLLHYREFRNRFHSGRTPLYTTTLVPLSSKFLEVASNNVQAALGNRLSYDIMESLVPGLMDLPYDEEGKAPTPSDRENLTLIQLAKRRGPGRVFAPEFRDEPTRQSRDSGVMGTSRRSPAEVLLDHARAALADEVVRSFMSATDREDAARVLEETARLGSLKRAMDGKALSHAIAIAAAFDRQDA